MHTNGVSKATLKSDCGAKDQTAIHHFFSKCTKKKFDGFLAEHYSATDEVIKRLKSSDIDSFILIVIYYIIL